MKKVVSKSFVLPLVLSVTIGLVSSFAHGWLDGRWVDRPNIEAIAAQLKDLPSEFGDWSLVENQQLSESTLSLLQCYGYSSQTYQNARTGRRVNVAVLFGPRGPIAVHTPEVCYSGQGLIPAGNTEQEVISVEGGDHTVWRVNFSSKRDLKPELEALKPHKYAQVSGIARDPVKAEAIRRVLQTAEKETGADRAARRLELQQR